MKKLFALHSPGKVDARVHEAIKNDLRKYVKRERRKSLPAGHDMWDFTCKIGADAAGSTSITLTEIGSAIDQIAALGGATVYIEILVQASHRPPPPARTTSAPTSEVTVPPDHEPGDSLLHSE
jgi:hypothetical protein